MNRIVLSSGKIWVKKKFIVRNGYLSSVKLAILNIIVPRSNFIVKCYIFKSAFLAADLIKTTINIKIISRGFQFVNTFG